MPFLIPNFHQYPTPPLIYVLNNPYCYQGDAGPEGNTDHPSPGDGTSETTPRTGTSVTSDDRTITGGSSQGPGEIRIEVQIENAVCVLYTDEKLLVGFILGKFNR